jgi:AsmA family
MKKALKFIKKLLFWFTVIMVVLIIAAIIILPKIFPLTKVANYAAEKAGEQIGRTISIKEVSFNPFKGVSLKGIVVSNDRNYSHRPMLDIKEVVLAYELMPLLRERKVVVYKAGIDGLTFLFEKKGKLNNLSSLVSAKKKSGTAKKKKKKSASKKSSGKMIDLNIGKIFIENSNIEYIDHKKSGDKILKIEDLNIVLKNISNKLEYSPAKLKGSVKIIGGGNTSKIKLDGKITGFKSADMELKIDKIHGDKLLSVFTDIKPKGTKKKKKKKKEKKPLKELNLDFTPLKGYKFVFVATLDDFFWGRLKVSGIKFKTSLDRMKFVFANEASLYGGKIDASVDANLAQSPAPYSVEADISKIDGEKFLDEGFDIEGAITGLMSAEAKLDGKLNFPTKFNGKVGTTFENGKIVNASKILPGVPESFFQGINNKGFDIFQMELFLKKGMPSVGALKVKGPEITIDKDFNLDAAKLQKAAAAQLAKEKARIAAEVKNKLEAEKKKIALEIERKKKEAEAKAQAEIDKQKNAVEDKVKNELENQIKGLGL